jgi:hypothetical protein
LASCTRFSPKTRWLALGLLHAVFAEDALARIENRTDAVRVEGLADGNQLDARRIASGGASGRGNAGLDGGQGGTGHDPESYGRACGPFQGLVLGRPTNARFSR